MKLIFDTADVELNCEQMQSILPQYVKMELDGMDPAIKAPAARTHLLQCPDCADEYQTLLDITRMEAQGQLPTADQILQQFPDSEPIPQDTEAVPLVAAAGQ